MIRSNPMVFGTFCVLIALGTSFDARCQEDETDAIVEMVLTLLNDSDKEMRALGLEQVRTGIPGQAVTKRLASKLPSFAPNVQAELISALTDRGDRAARPAIISVISDSREEAVRVAALRALGFLGDVDDVPRLIQTLSSGSSAEKTTTVASLGRLPGEPFSRAIASEMNRAEPSLRIKLMEVLVARRASTASKDLLRFAMDDDPSTRSAAMKALSHLAGPEQVAGMAKGILVAEKGKERDSAEKCVMLVCCRIEDSEKRTAPLLRAMKPLKQTEQLILLPTVGRIGGPEALSLATKAIASSELPWHQAGVRSLSNWPDASVSDKLMTVVQTDEHSGCRTAALRALIRVAPVPDGRSDTRKLDLLKKTWQLCKRDQEKNLVLKRASAIRIVETLRFLVPFLSTPAYAQQACQSVVELAHHRALRDAHKTEFAEALNAVKRISSNETVIDRADRYLKGQTWTRR